MLPLAGIVSFSRIYNGAHYPGGRADWHSYRRGLRRRRRLVRRRSLAMGWPALVPRLARPTALSHAARLRTPSGTLHPPSSLEKRWLNLGFVLIALLLLLRSRIWPREKPSCPRTRHTNGFGPNTCAILLQQAAPDRLRAVPRTHLWGDNEFGVRFFSPVISAGLSLLLLRFLAGELNARAAFCIVTILNLTPLMALAPC